MSNNNELAVKFIDRLLEHPKVKDLENYGLPLTKAIELYLQQKEKAFPL